MTNEELTIYCNALENRILKLEEQRLKDRELVLLMQGRLLEIGRYAADYSRPG